MTFWKSLFNRNKKSGVYSNGNYDTLDFLYKELKDQIKGYNPHLDLVAKIKHFNQLSPKKKLDSFPSLYLEIEDFLLFQEGYHSKTKHDFREVIFMEYPSITKYEELHVIFLEYKVQKLALSRQFLKDALKEAKELLGNFKDDYLIKAEQMLANPFMIDSFSTQIEVNSIQKQVLDHSIALQQKLEESLGQNAMLSIFTNAYNKHFNKYYLLEGFTAVVHLIPEELLIIDSVNTPSKGQMHRLLKTQISILEEINTKLSKEVQERKQIQKDLERNERLYSAVLHNSLHANLIVDKEGHILRWNEKAEALFKEGENVFDLIPKVFTSHVQDQMNHTSLKEVKNLALETFAFEHSIDSVIHQFSLKISPIFVDEEILFFCVANNITKQRQK